ncbi:hypothetical protein [Roseomonas xinghualingensis]|uniref:hypothetical protein n=1 Tax=Roseomonas xinghualingensis TaxID=2986475 RepID=UPI0021F223FC|nr:hypothetical protein [Roseomonas sp. SXEYE001]
MIAALLALLLSVAPHAQAASTPVQGPCFQGSCIWFRVLEDEIGGAGPGGLMHRLRVRWWESTHPRGRGERRGTEEQLLIVCSGKRPAMLVRRDGGWWQQPLDPGQEIGMGPNAGPIALYGWICHGIVLGDETSPTLTEFYPTRRDMDELEGRRLARLEDALR